VKNISYSFFTEGNVDNPLIVDQVRAYLLIICRKLINCCVVLHDQRNRMYCIPFQRIYPGRCICQVRENVSLVWFELTQP
jgi:hypothetical protein